MKIIEAISDTNIGGAGVLLINRLSCTDMKKYKTLVLLPKDSALCKRLEEICVPYIEIDCRGDKSFDLSALWKYKEQIKKFAPDIINAHGALTARVAAKMCGVPIKICTRHCVYPISAKEKLSGCLNSALSDCFVAVSHTARDNLVNIGINPKKISVIINGARPLKKYDEIQKRQLRYTLGIGQNTTVLGICARLESCKGHECLLGAVKKLTREGADIFTLIIGDGTQKEHLMRICKEYGIEGRVHFCGFVSDTSRLMSIVDINISCSVGTETSSLALSEGMSIGLPAVVSDYGGNPYMVQKGINGFVYPRENYVRLAYYIKRLIEDRALYLRMSAAAQKRFESELNAEKMTQSTNKLYDTLYMTKK